jgi:flagellar biosynthesis GTPase FlhF
MAFEGKNLEETLKGTIRMAAGALMASVATTHASGWHDQGLTGGLLHTTLNVTIGSMAAAVSGGDVACGALGALMAQYAGKALKDHFGENLTERQMIAIVQSGAAIFAGMLGKNPSEAAAAALVVMECDILRARGPSAEEIAEAERQEAERKKAEAEAKERAEEEARLEKRRLQDEEIARQNEKLRKDKEKLAAQAQEREAAKKRAAEEKARGPELSLHEEDYRDMVHHAYGINPEPVPVPEDPRAQVQNQLHEQGLDDDFGMEPGYHYAGHSPVIEEHKKRIAEVDVVSLIKQGGKNAIDWVADKVVSVARQKGMGHRPRSHSANARMAGRVDAVNKGADKALAHVAPDPAGPEEKANRLRLISQARHDEARRFKEHPWQCVDMMHPYAAQALGELAAPVVMPVIEVAADVVNVAGDLGVHAVGAVVRGGAELDGYNKDVAKGVAGVAEKGVEVGLLFGALGVRQGAKALAALKKAERLAGGLELGAAGKHLAQHGHHAGDLVEHAGKAFPQGVKDLVQKPEKALLQKVNNRMPRNHVHAGKLYPMKDLPVELRIKYPHGVYFTHSGFPDFTRYAIRRVQINITGNNKIDKVLANKAAGYTKTPKDYVWHHHHDGKTMELIPLDLHDAIQHTGGGAIARANKLKGQ